MTRRQTASIVFVVLCVVLVAAAITLNIGWILANGRRVAPLIFGVTTFSLIIAGLIVYTVFLVREMGITEQQDSFLNSVTHELKTPIASIRLYLETLQAREVGDAQRKEFYRIMLQDAERLQHTVEQVLRAGVARQRRKLEQRAPVDLGWLVQECIDTARTRHHLAEDAIVSTGVDLQAPLVISGDVEDLRTAVTNLLDNAVKYSNGPPQISVQVAGATSAFQRRSSAASSTASTVSSPRDPRSRALGWAFTSSAQSPSVTAGASSRRAPAKTRAPRLRLSCPE